MESIKIEGGHLRERARVFPRLQTAPERLQGGTIRLQFFSELDMHKIFSSSFRQRVLAEFRSSARTYHHLRLAKLILSKSLAALDTLTESNIHGKLKLRWCMKRSRYRS